MCSHNNIVCVGQADVFLNDEYISDDIHHIDFDLGFDFSDDFSVRNGTTDSSFDSIDSGSSSGNYYNTQLRNRCIFSITHKILPLQSRAPASITPSSEVQSGKEVVNSCEKFRYHLQKQSQMVLCCSREAWSRTCLDDCLPGTLPCMYSPASTGATLCCTSPPLCPDISTVETWKLWGNYYILV